MKYYIIAGEASGDMHGANLIAGLQQLDKNATFRCWGGDKMHSGAVEIVKHIKDLAFMGFAEVLFNIRTILKNIKFCKQDILAYKPDVLILIDYPGFNLRIAEFAKANSIKVFYYISPSIWAWKEKRVEIIKRAVDRMFVILPFEKAFYAKHNVVVDYEGHPLVDELKKIKSSIGLKEDFIASNKLSGKEIIACMPGSRKQEIKVMLGKMLALQKDFPQYEFVVAGAPNLPETYYKSVTNTGNTRILYGQTYALLTHAKAGLIKSGTSVLEAAMFHLPQVCCYYGNGVTIWIAKRLAKVKYISLPNLILNKPVITELIQEDMNYEKMKTELNLLLNDNGRKSELESNYLQLDEILAGEGASDRIASKMYKYLTSYESK